MVEVKIDIKNREDLMRLHTATHILNFSAREVLGSHVWQNGSNLKREIGSLDITHYDNISSEDIFKIENLVNKTIFENRPLIVEELDRAIAEKKYGFVLYQGGAVPMKVLRVISIENNDVEACGGLHVENTGKVGLLKIVDSQKIQDGVVRLRFVVGEHALDFISEKQKKLNDVCEILTVSEADVEKSADKFVREWRQRGKDVDKLKLDVKAGYLAQIKSSDKTTFELKNEFDMGFIMELFGEIKKDKSSFKLVSPKFIVATSDIEVVEEHKKAIDKKAFKIYIR